MEGNNANHYTSHADDTETGGCIDCILVAEGQNGFPHCILRVSNSRGLCPLELNSSALTTRPRMQCYATNMRIRTTQKAQKKRQQPKTKQNTPRVRLDLTTYRLTAGRAADCAIQECYHTSRMFEFFIAAPFTNAIAGCLA